MSPLILSHNLLPASWLHSTVYDVLTIFVALNTIMYAALAVAKILPALHLTEWLPHQRRRETRSIYPDGESDGGR